VRKVRKVRKVREACRAVAGRPVRAGDEGRGRRQIPGTLFPRFAV